MRLQIFKDVQTRVPRKRLFRLFDSIVGGEAEEHWAADVNLVLIDDARMKMLNQQFRDKDRSTDVLSFVLDGPEAEGDTFGEIYISVPTAARQAGEYGASVTEEFLRLFGHGLLHLFGYDHIKEEEEVLMKAREEVYLSAEQGKRN